jgi:hypothetical protein
LLWALLVALDPRLLEAGKTSMSASDQLSVELFLISLVIIIFGAVLLAARDRVLDLWNVVVLKRVERKIIRSKVRKSPPPFICGKTKRCRACQPIEPSQKAAPAGSAEQTRAEAPATC